MAGITETEKFGWTNQTKNVLIERAYFNPLQLKKTARRLNIPILSASFFSLSETLPRLIYFLGETQKNGLDSEIIFTYQKHSFKPRLIRVSQLFLEKKIGQPFPSLQIEKILKQLNFPYSKKGKIYQIKILSHRSDLRIPEDLLEELLRIYDYNQIVGSVS